MWKSDNQSFKEATFIYMGRRGRDMEIGEARRCGMVQRGDGGGGMGGPTFTDGR